MPLYTAIKKPDCFVRCENKNYIYLSSFKKKNLYYCSEILSCKSFKNRNNDPEFKKRKEQEEKAQIEEEEKEKAQLKRRRSQEKKKEREKK